MTGRNLLVVDDEEGIRIGLSRFFERTGFTVHGAEDSSGALKLIGITEFAAAILDVRLKGGESGQDLVPELLKRNPGMPIIMITGYGSVESAVEAMRLGASDYVIKPVDNARLLESLGKHLELQRLRTDNSYLKGELLRKLYDHDVITQDPAYIALLALADRVKDTQAAILLTGESGTGKDVMARYMHFTSVRRDGPFVGVNCAALSESLLLSELFGHERGSFTGAIEKRLGKFELAHHGTLFLDEIGDMALSAQAKFLRVLEESSFERVGGAKRISVDIRVIAATNRDLGELMRRGEFRSDLFFRLNIVNLRMPPLRERRCDIPLLVDYFISKYALKYNRQVSGASAALLESWTAYPWPGNVRELQNTVNQAVLLASGPVIDERTFAGSPVAAVCPDPAGIDIDDYATLKDLRDAVQARYEKLKIGRSLEANAWNRSRTALALDITRKTLAAKMKEFGMERERERKPTR